VRREQHHFIPNLGQILHQLIQQLFVRLGQLRLIKLVVGGDEIPVAADLPQGLGLRIALFHLSQYLLKFRIRLDFIVDAVDKQRLAGLFFHFLQPYLIARVVLLVQRRALFRVFLLHILEGYAQPAVDPCLQAARLRHIQPQIMWDEGQTHVLVAHELILAGQLDLFARGGDHLRRVIGLVVGYLLFLRDRATHGAQRQRDD